MLTTSLALLQVLVQIITTMQVFY